MDNSDGKESACNSEDPGSVPVLGRSPGEGNGNPLLYSCTWKIPCIEEHGRLQSMGSQSRTQLNTHSGTHIRRKIALGLYPVNSVPSLYFAKHTGRKP